MHAQRTPPAGPPTQLDLMTAQLEAIEAWNRARRLTEGSADAARMTREARMDLSRRMEGRRREQAALIARADAQLRATGELLGRTSGTRAVLAHRDPWLREKVIDRLTSSGVTIVGEFEDGADAAGTAVAEQPDLVFVEDRLPTLTGAEVVRRVRSFSPRTVVGAQVLDSAGIGVLVDAGAQAVFTRRIPPLELADQLLLCLHGDGRTLTFA